jgi:hypothetical protein
MEGKECGRQAVYVDAGGLFNHDSFSVRGALNSEMLFYMNR